MLKRLIETTRFGVEVEFVGIRREQSAEIVAKALNSKNIEHPKSAVYVVKDADNREWTIKREPSLVTIRQWQNELITPILTLKDLPKLKEIVTLLYEANARASTSCGIHVHVDAEPHNAKTIRNLLELYLANEHLLYEALNVDPDREEEFCQKLNDREHFAEAIEQVKDMNDLEKVWYLGYEEKPNHTKYFGLNLHAIWRKGTIEFRLFNGTMDPQKIEAYVRLVLGLNAKALTENRIQAGKAESNKQEMKKLLEAIGMEQELEKYLMEGFEEQVIEYDEFDVIEIVPAE